jgi:alkanesulfonate monooxygenase SsuD/methylene tetrahydromethanopterin reductase-like flavin-dependent oxidoreductase (luciferase family)
VIASRALVVGPSREAAAAAARGYLERTFTMYRTWEMQEATMQKLQLGFDVPLESWTVCGTPADCVETLARARAIGLDGVGFTIYSLPREAPARIEYLRMIAEEILRPAGALLPPEPEARAG